MRPAAAPFTAGSGDGSCSKATDITDPRAILKANVVVSTRVAINNWTYPPFCSDLAHALCLTSASKRGGGGRGRTAPVEHPERPHRMAGEANHRFARLHAGRALDVGADGEGA